VYDLDTNMHGEERAFVMTGQYDKVLPMNIMPVMLLKAILARDIERMEQLGIYEVAEEDFALCEFVCTSKIDVQKIIAEGLTYMQTEG
jgi:Na+-transporting NADH:ubiquinone oxidoreductase subunit A